MAKQPDLPDPRTLRLLANADFKVLLAGMRRHRQKLFDTGESDEDLRMIFEKRGKRKMLAFLLTEGGVDDLIRDTKNQ